MSGQHEYTVLLGWSYLNFTLEALYQGCISNLTISSYRILSFHLQYIKYSFGNSEEILLRTLPLSYHLKI